MNIYLNKYERNKKARVEYPLSSGVYKLKEVLQRYGSLPNEIARIAGYLQRGDEMPKFLKHCAREELDEWLHERPVAIISDAGYNVVPAIEALGGDGVPVREVRKIKRRYVPVVESIVRDCEGLLSGELDLHKLACVLDALIEVVQSILNDVQRIKSH